MAKVPIKKIKVYGLKKDRKSILRKVQHLGVIEVFGESAVLPERSDEFESKQANSVSSSCEDIQKVVSVLDDGLAAVSEAMKIVTDNLDSTQKKLVGVGPFYEPFLVKESDFEELVKETDGILDVARGILDENREIAQIEAEISKLKLEKESLEFWKNLDIPTNVVGISEASCFIGTLPPEFDDEVKILNAIGSKLGSSFNNMLHVEVVSKTSELVYLFLLCRKSDADLVLKELLNFGFISCKYSSSKTPAQEIELISESIRSLETRLDELKGGVRSRVNYLEKLRFVYDYYLSKKESYEVIAKLQNTKKVFVLTGYVPRNKTALVENALRSFSNAFIEVEDVKACEDAPVLLHNPGFVAAVEPVLESYSLPSEAELDPTSVMSVFYYFLFGLMLSDAGYGAVMSLVCGGVLLKHRNMKSSLKKSFTMFFICGVFTFFWGLMFGSFFGDAIEVIASTFFGVKISTPTLWFVPIKKPMLMLSFSFGVGILHMFTGLFLKFIQLVKARRYLDAIFDVASWVMLVGGLIVFMLSVPMVPRLLDIQISVGPSVATVSKFFMLLGALIIVFTSGRGGGSLFKRLLKGLYGLYGITNYLSDIISYSRLLALGLSTGVIAQVFNKMGAMGGNSLFGVILFALVFLVGHTVNILINLLGAYVHTNRLQFVEFFSKFYEGGGRKFSPFSFKTKYCTFLGR